MSSPYEWTEIDREYPPPGEAEDIAETIRLNEIILRLTDGPILRGQHAKGTGGVRARLVVDPNRPAETRFGIFEPTRTYEAIVRFSNGMGRLRPDGKKDARGMAIKVLGVEGLRALDEEDDRDTQDFVMINFPVFAFRNVRQYRKLTAMKRLLMSTIGKYGNELSQLIFFIPWHFSQFWNVGRKLKRKSRSPLIEQYWSMSPYRLGTRAIKFTAVPQAINWESLPPTEQDGSPSPDLLSWALAEHLRRREARFNIKVQFQNDSKAMPIEDPTVVWNESDSEPVTVGTVIIDPVDITTDEAVAFRKSVEAMSFNPWHSLEAHRPIGGLNRLRKALYLSNARLRRESAARS
jgi:Catalase